MLATLSFAEAAAAFSSLRFFFSFFVNIQSSALLLLAASVTSLEALLVTSARAALAFANFLRRFFSALAIASSCSSELVPIFTGDMLIKRRWAPLKEGYQAF